MRLRNKLHGNAKRFRKAMAEAEFDLLDGEHPIVPVMFGDAVLAAQVATEMMNNGVYVTAFSFPVVPRDKARIRVQLSASHSDQDVDNAVAAFVRSRAKARLS